MALRVLNAGTLLVLGLSNLPLRAGLDPSFQGFNTVWAAHLDGVDGAAILASKPGKDGLVVGSSHLLKGSRTWGTDTD